MHLTKSDFLKYQICPSYFWLWKHKNEVAPKDDEDEIKRLLEQGNEVEAYARKLFPDGVLVEGFGEAAKQQTQDLVASSVKVIFQATVLTESGLLAMADIIERTDDGSWNLYEVKSTNTVKKEHIYDLAFQKAAFEQAGYSVATIGVIHTNKAVSYTHLTLPTTPYV